MEKQGEVSLYVLAPQAGALMQSCVVRTKNGKLIVLDGGGDGQGREDPAYLPAALRAIMRVGQEDYIEVEAWILSHAHKDHFGELKKVLEENYDNENFVIKNLYFDFPPFGTKEFPYQGDDFEALDLLKNALSKYARARGFFDYDELNGRVVNAKSIADGSADMEIDGIHIEFMQTWNKSNGTDINDTSLVFRMWSEGQSVLFLNDAHHAAGVALLAKYGADLKSDSVQMAHHGQRGVTKEVYGAIAASKRIWCTPIWVWENTKDFEIGDTRSWVNGGEDFTTASERDIVTCLYAKYPEESTSVKSWQAVIDFMEIKLD